MMEHVFDSPADLLADPALDVESMAADLGDADVLAAAEQLIRLGRRADALAARILAEADARGAADVEFGQRTATWVAHATRDSRRAAHQRLRAGRGCRRLPLVAGAWTDGRLSVDHVTVLARAVSNPRVTDHVVGLQQLLIDRAAEVPFETWRNEVFGIVETLDADGSFQPEAPDTPSVLHLLPLFDGTHQLHAELSAADHAVVSSALNAEADALFRRYSRDHDETGGSVEIPPRAQLLAEALVSLCRKGAAVDVDSTAPLRPEAVIVIHDNAPDTAVVNGDDRPVDIRHLGGLLSDANWRRIVLDAKGDVVDIGRTRRLASRGQRRALDIRDGGCCFPGCDAPASWCDAHHLNRWEDGGSTDLTNMLLLCRHHHGVVHRAGWSWLLDPDDGRVRWITPNGTVLTSQRRRRPPDDTPLPRLRDRAAAGIGT